MHTSQFVHACRATSLILEHSKIFNEVRAKFQSLEQNAKCLEALLEHCETRDGEILDILRFAADGQEPAEDRNEVHLHLCRIHCFCGNPAHALSLRSNCELKLKVCSKLHMQISAHFIHTSIRCALLLQSIGSNGQGHVHRRQLASHARSTQKLLEYYKYSSRSLLPLDLHRSGAVSGQRLGGRRLIWEFIVGCDRRRRGNGRCRPNTSPGSPRRGRPARCSDRQSGPSSQRCGNR